MSTVDRIWPPAVSGGGGGATSSWAERVAIDFTSESWAPVADGETETFESTQWTVKVGSPYPPPAGYPLPFVAGDYGVDGTGMFIEPKAVGDWWNATFNAPRFFAELTNGADPLYPNGGLGQAFAFQAIIESPVDIAADYDCFGIIIADGGTSLPAGGYSIQLRRIWYNAIGGAHQSVAMQGGGAQFATYMAEATPHTFYEAVFFGSNVYLSSGPYTDFADPMTRTDFRAQYNPNVIRGKTPGNWTIDANNLMFLFYGFGSGSATVGLRPQMSKFRLLSIGAEGALQP